MNLGTKLGCLLTCVLINCCLHYGTLVASLLLWNLFAIWCPFGFLSWFLICLYPDHQMKIALGVCWIRTMSAPEDEAYASSTAVNLLRHLGYRWDNLTRRRKRQENSYHSDLCRVNLTVDFQVDIVESFLMNYYRLFPCCFYSLFYVVSK